MVVGQRGKDMLFLNGYTLARNNILEKTTYWNCRSRNKYNRPCRARVMTWEKPNGLHRVTITQPLHNHLPSQRIQKLIMKKYETRKIEN